MRLVFLGPPGAGKGTQAQMLAASKGWPHISTGDLLRAARASGTELGLKAKSYMDKGELVPDALICDVVAERLKGADCATGWILDGFPRTRGQAGALADTLARMGQKLDRVVYFDIAFGVLIDRLVGRLTCKNCSAPYHRTSKVPKVAGKCDTCGGELIQRPDDREDVVTNRLKTYDDMTKELIAHYRSEGSLVTIDALGSLDQVTGRLVAALQAR